MAQDIFISYKNDGVGQNLAARLAEDLEERNFSVYCNLKVKHTGSFPDRLREAIRGCKDFILLLSQDCMDQLIRHNKVDWVREEILTARESGKHIIPILWEGVKMPKDKNKMPPELSFLPDLDAIVMSELYKSSPFEDLISIFDSKPEKDEIYRDYFNSGKYRLDEEFRRIKASAEGGSARDMYDLALNYYYGIYNDEGTSARDYGKAYELLSALSAQHNEYSGYADSLLGEMYYAGVIPQQSQSFETAIEYHKKAASVSGFSAREYAYLKSKGLDGSFDFDEIEKDYMEAVKTGDRVAILGLAQFYKTYGRYQDAARLYRNTYKVVPESELELGRLYVKGVLNDPPMPDYHRAAAHFHHVISTGKCSAKAYYELGCLYLMPFGDFTKDDALAQELFLKAASLGSIQAAYKLGWMFEYGIVEKNLIRSIQYYTQASDGGMPLAAYHLAMLYQQPEVCNYHKAFLYAKTAADRGSPEGEYILGNLFLFGRGCIADPDEAVRYFHQAYGHGVYPAKIMLERLNAE